MSRGGDRELFGRDEQLAVLAQMVTATARGSSAAIVIEAEAGMGKTRLVEECIDVAATAGFTVHLAVCEALTADLPFGPLVSALRDDQPRAETIRRQVESLLTSERQHDPSLLAIAVPEVRAQMIESIASLIAKEAATAPVVVIVEDAQWSDGSTALALREVLRAASGLPLLVVATTRPLMGNDHVARALLDAGAQHMRLPPLTDDAVSALVTHTLGAPPGPRLTELTRGASGNPLLIRSLVDGLKAEGHVARANGLADVGTQVIPRSLGHQVLRTLAAIGKDARGVLRLAAVLGTTFTALDLADVSGLSISELATAIDEAIVCGLLRPDDGALSFRHDLVREAIYAELPAAMRSAVHRELARSLAARHAPTARIAAHFSLGAQPGDEEALSWIHKAAREAMSSAPATAVALLERAASIAVAGSPAHADVLADQVEALGMAGRLEEAEAAAAQAIRMITDPERLAATKRLQGLALLLRNRCADAAAVLEELAISAPDSGCLAEAGLAALGAGDLDRAEGLANEALTRAHRDDGAKSLASTVLARISSLRGDFDAMFEHSQRSLDVADQALDRFGHRHLPLFFHAMALFDADRLTECHETLAAGRLLAEQHGVAFAGPLHDALSAFAHLRAGDIDSCAAEAASGLAACDETGMDVALVMCLALSALADIHRNEIDPARAAVHRARDIAAARPPWMGLDLLVIAEARLAEASEPSVEEGAAAALRLLLPGFELLTAVGAMTMSMTLAADVVRLATACGDQSAATSAIRALDEASHLVALPSWRGAWLQARGRLEGDPGLLVDAVETYRGSPRRLELALALELAAEHSDATSAPAMLSEAITIYREGGAVRDASRATAALRARGGRAQRTATTRPAGVLSPAETSVARLVAQGLSNPEIAARLFVGRRTVETHLRRIYAKLDLGSRVDLAVWFERNG